MSKAETKGSDSWVKAGDILAPAATLLGLVLAAVGFSASIPGISTILRPVSLARVLVVILFAGAALLACVASLLRSNRVSWCRRSAFFDGMDLPWRCFALPGRICVGNPDISD